MRKVALLGVHIAALVALAAVTTAGAVTSGKSVKVTLNEFNVLPGTQAAPAGR